MRQEKQQKAFIAGCLGTALTADEARFFAEHRPWGLCLFLRNCNTKEQIRDLIAGFREAVGVGDAPILIDQEGGRVQRLTPPGWRRYPSALKLAHWQQQHPDSDAVYLVTRLIMRDVIELDIRINCLPVLDVPVAGSDNIIGDRAYGDHPDKVIGYGSRAYQAVIDGGGVPVIKHIPGHGRAEVDSHKQLPVVAARLEDLQAQDFPPFKALAHAAMAMSAHVIYRAIDTDRPATISPDVIDQLIRGMIGFDGLLISDDLSMAALSGSLAERTGAALAAGCDLALHCNGDIAEMVEVAAAAGVLSGPAKQRADRVIAKISAPHEFDVDRAEAIYKAVMA